MKCRQARDLAIESVRSGSPVVDPHFASCGECSRFLQTQQAIHSGLGSLSREMPAPADLEAKLLAEFDAASGATRPRLRWWIPAGAALAACMVIVAVVLRHPTPVPQNSSEVFVEIPYTAPLTPYERSTIVRMDVPVSALIAAGFDVRAPDTGAVLKADILFGQDGRAHAIRPLTGSVLTSN
jgi:hypothetical protein